MAEQEATSPRRRGRPVTTGGLPNVLAIRGRAEWKAWLEEVAAARGVGPTEFIDEALVLAAKRWKLPAPPDRV